MSKTVKIKKISGLFMISLLLATEFVISVLSERSMGKVILYISSIIWRGFSFFVEVYNVRGVLQ